MTAVPQTSPAKPNRAVGVRIGLMALLGATLMLAGCGRKGAPEYDSGEPVVKANTAQQVPGLPQKSETAKPKIKPKGNFILDPLL